MEKLAVKTEAGKISYLKGGQGKNLILLHSLNLSSESWSKVFEPLAKNHTVYAVDMPGHGDSDKPPRNFLIGDYVNSIMAFMDQLKIDQAIVCGNSVGALLALEMAASNPKRVDKLILVGCPAWDPWERIERITLASLSFDVEGNPKPLSLADLAMPIAHPTNELLTWFNQQRAKAGLWVKKTLIAIALYDALPRMAQIKCPTLVLFGTKDFLRDKEQILLQEIKGTKSAYVEDAGHIPQLEKPEDFLKAVTGFLS